MWAFFGRLVYSGAYCAGTEKSGFVRSDLRCTCNVIVATRTKRDIRHADQKPGSFRVFANQESRKCTDSSGCYLQRLHCDSRGQRRARKSAIAQSAVAQSDREYRLYVCRIPKRSPTCDRGFHSTLRVSPLRRVFCQRAHPCPGIYSGILSAITVHAKFRRALCPSLIRFATLLFLCSLLSHTLFLTCTVPLR